MFDASFKFGDQEDGASVPQKRKLSMNEELKGDDESFGPVTGRARRQSFDLLNTMREHTAHCMKLRHKLCNPRWKKERAKLQLLGKQWHAGRTGISYIGRNLHTIKEELTPDVETEAQIN